MIKIIDQYFLNQLSSGFRRYLANTSWLFLAQFFSLGLSFFISVFIARYLGPAIFGNFNYVLSLTTIVGMFFCSSFDFVLVRELVKRPDQRQELLGTFWFIKLIGGFLTLLIAVIVANFQRVDNLTLGLSIILAIFYIVQSFNVVGLFFQAEVAAKNNSQAQIIANLISSVLKIFWLFWGLNVLFLASIYVVDIAINVFLLIHFYQKLGFSLKSWKFNRSEAVQVLKMSWPLMLSGLSIYAVLRIDQVIIGVLLDKVAVGYYAVADRLTEIWDFIPKLICLSVFPALINAHRVSLASYQRRKKMLYSLMVIISFLIMIPVYFLADWVIIKFFGQEYWPAAEILKIYIFSLPGIFLLTAINQAMLADGREKTIFIINFCGMLLNVGLNLLLLPRYGLMGSAWATVITFIFLPMTLLIFGRLRLAKNKYD